MPKKSNPKALPFDQAVEELVSALALPYGAALALLCGLCATEEVSCFTKDPHWRQIDPDKEPMGNAARPLLVNEDDFRDWMRRHCQVSSSRDDEITRRLRANEVPGENISWKEFCDGVRDRCGGWIKKGKPNRGFSDKQIQRMVRELRQ
jgi:hypothetical protein